MFVPTYARAKPHVKYSEYTVVENKSRLIFDQVQYKQNWPIYTCSNRIKFTNERPIMETNVIEGTKTKPNSPNGKNNETEKFNLPNLDLIYGDRLTPPR